MLPPILHDLSALVDRTPHPARPFLAAILARGPQRYMPGEFAAFIAGRIGVQRQPDTILSSAMVIAFRERGDADVCVVASLRNLRRAPLPTRRAAMRALRALREASRIVARYAAARRPLH